MLAMLCGPMTLPSSHQTRSYRKMQHQHGNDGAAVSLNMTALHQIWLHSGNTPAKKKKRTRKQLSDRTHRLYIDAHHE